MIQRMLLTTFVCLSATLSTYAKPKEGGKIDKVKYEITYHTKSITDTTRSIRSAISFTTRRICASMWANK